MMVKKPVKPRLWIASSSRKAEAGPDPVTRQAGVAGPGTGAGWPGPDDVVRKRLLFRILATTDIHAQILSYDYYANRPVFGLGLAQTASLIAEARAEEPNSILVDNGDFLQGTALADLAASSRRRRTHPAITAFNVLGYDAAALGNHEFNYGLEVLERALADARFPVVSANVFRLDGKSAAPLVQPFAILERSFADLSGERHLLRIGVLGLTPPEILKWDRAHLEGRVSVRPMVEAAREQMRALREAGADVVICLAHTGISEEPGFTEDEGHAADIAAIPGIDVLVAGHTHRVFPQNIAREETDSPIAEGLVSGKPAVQPGHSGSHLGIIDLTLEREAGRWVVVGARSRAVSASEVVAGLPARMIQKNAAPLRDAIAADHRAALSWTRRTLGQLDLPLTTYFATAADTQALRLVAAAKVAHVRKLFSRGPYAGLPVVANAIPFRAGGRGGSLNYTDIPAGPFSVRHVFDLYSFPNSLVALRTTAARLIDELERSAVLFNRIAPGDVDVPLLDPKSPSFAFAMIPGFSFQIDLSVPQRYSLRGVLINPGAHRISSVTFHGRPVAPDDPFVLVTNTYRASGSLGLPVPRPEEVLIADSTLITTVIQSYITSQGRIAPIDGPGWGFAPMPGTTVTYDSGAAAVNHLDEVAHLRPDLVGLTDAGFHRFRLHL